MICAVREQAFKEDNFGSVGGRNVAGMDSSPSSATVLIQNIRFMAIWYVSILRVDFMLANEQVHLDLLKFKRPMWTYKKVTEYM